MTKAFLIGLASVLLAGLSGACGGDEGGGSGGAFTGGGAGGGNGGSNATGGASAGGGSGGGSGGSNETGGASAGGGAGGGTGADCASACSAPAFNCVLSGYSGAATATISNPESYGCSGMMSVDTEQPPLWIHCDTGQICVEHATECFQGTFTSTSFSYVIPSKGVTVTCTKS